jgi:hypothetical protein
MKFIGHLYLRKMLMARVMGQVLQDLALCSDANAYPSEHILECICTLLNNIGYTLESMPAGKDSISQVCGRLLELKTRKTKKTNKPIYPMRIQFLIQDLLDTKNAGWVSKTFKLGAKTKEQIREDAKRDEKNQKADGSEVVVAGQRPEWITRGGDGPSAAKDDGPWEDVPKKTKR